MVSEKIQRLLDKEANGEPLTKSEEKSLYNYRYRTQHGKSKRERSQQLYADRFKQVGVSIPREYLSALERLIGKPATGANIRDFLLRLISEKEQP